MATPSRPTWLRSILRSGDTSIYAEQNFFRTDGDVEPSDFIDRFNGTAVVTLATQVNAASANHAVDVRAAYNERFNPDPAEHDWIPTLFLPVDPAFRVPSLVASQAGPFNG